MPHRKIKCTGCKERFDRDTMIRLPAGPFCTFECATQLGIRRQQRAKERALRKAEKEKKKADAAYKKNYRNNDRKIRKKATKTACHAYIRYRDKDELCICCDKPLGESYQAGHYLESGNNPQIRYDERNIHAQRVDCNYFKGGDSGKYRENLIKRIGLENVLELESMKGGTDKRTPQDLKEIEVYYKDKLNRLKENEH